MLIRRNRDFRLLLVASTVDAVGTWLLVLAVPLEIFRVKGSALNASLALAVQAVPAVAIGPWAGAAVDRWPRKKVLVGANLVGAAGVALMLGGCYVTGLVVESVAACFLRPALRAVTPAVVRDEGDLAEANVLTAFSDSALRLAGPLAGTLLTTAGWFDAVVLVDVLSYCAAAVIVARIAIPTASAREGVAAREKASAKEEAALREKAAAGEISAVREILAARETVAAGVDLDKHGKTAAKGKAVGGEKAAVRGKAAAGGDLVARQKADVRERADRGGKAAVWAGFGYVLNRPSLRVLLIGSWHYWTANAALTALLVPFAATRLHDERALGYLITGLGVGYLAGSAVSRGVIGRYPAPRILAFAYAMVGVCFLVMVNAGTLAVALVAVTVAGVPGVIAVVAVSHHLQSTVPEGLLGRVGAAFYTSDGSAAVIGALLAAAAIKVTTLTVAMNLFSALVLVAAGQTATRPASSRAVASAAGRGRDSR